MVEKEKADVLGYITSHVLQTLTWEEWVRTYSTRLEVQHGVCAILTPIPPDTLESVLCAVNNFEGRTNHVSIGKINEELSQYGIVAKARGENYGKRAPVIVSFYKKRST